MGVLDPTPESYKAKLCGIEVSLALTALLHFSKLPPRIPFALCVQEGGQRKQSTRREIRRGRSSRAGRGQRRETAAGERGALQRVKGFEDRDLEVREAFLERGGPGQAARAVVANL